MRSNVRSGSEPVRSANQTSAPPPSTNVSTLIDEITSKAADTVALLSSVNIRLQGHGPETSEDRGSNPSIIGRIHDLNVLIDTITVFAGDIDRIV